MYQVGNFVEMKKPHACIIKSTGKKYPRKAGTPSKEPLQ